LDLDETGDSTLHGVSDVIGEHTIAVTPPLDAGHSVDVVLKELALKLAPGLLLRHSDAVLDAQERERLQQRFLPVKTFRISEDPTCVTRRSRGWRFSG
jgi:hypothetical protein